MLIMEIHSFFMKLENIVMEKGALFQCKFGHVKKCFFKFCVLRRKLVVAKQKKTSIKQNRD